MTRATSCGNPLFYDPEIERSNRACTKAVRERRRTQRQAENPPGPIDEISLEGLFDEANHSDPIRAIVTMANPERTIRDLSRVPVNQQPSCIVYPAETEENMFEMRSWLVNSLPKFHGRPTDDPNQHLQKFHLTVQSMKPPKVDLHLAKLKSFPFSFEDLADDWFCHLKP